MTPLDKIRLNSFLSFSRPTWEVSLSVTVALAAIALATLALRRYLQPSSLPASDGPKNLPAMNSDGERIIPYQVISKTVRKSRRDQAASLPQPLSQPRGQWGGHLVLTQTIIDAVKEVLPPSYTNPDILMIKHPSPWIFSLPKIAPNLVFMMSQGGYEIAGRRCTDNDLTNLMFQNIQKGIEVCKAHQLYLLVIPPMTKFKVEVKGEKYTVIAQERIDYNPHLQKEEYYKHAETMVETVRQLTTFIALTGLERVEWENMPIVNGNFPGPRQIALLSWKFMENPNRGIFGRAGYPMPGLVGSVFSEKQLDVVLEEASKRGIVPPSDSSREIEKTAKGRKKIRLQEIEYDRQLRLFHDDKGISANPRKPLQMDDLSLLNLDLEEKATIVMMGNPPESITMRKVIERLLEHINESIKNADETCSTQDKRFVCFEEDFRPYYALGSSEAAFFNLKRFTDEQIKELWINRILQALLDQELIYGFGVTLRRGYFYVQA